MEAKAALSSIRISPKKFRLVANEVRGMDALDASRTLKFMPQKSAGVLDKLLNSAIANAKVLNQEIKLTSLYIKKLYVDQAPSMKRVRPRARGRADRILRRFSKVTVVISDE